MSAILTISPKKRIVFIQYYTTKFQQSVREAILWQL